MTKSLTDIRNDLMAYIQNHKSLPDFVKAETKQLAAQQFNAIGKAIALAELTFHRTNQKGIAK